MARTDSLAKLALLEQELSRFLRDALPTDRDGRSSLCPAERAHPQ